MSHDSDPGRGDVEAIRRVAGARRRRASAVGDAIRMLNSCAPADPRWKGQSSVAFSAGIDERVVELTAIQERYAEHARELDFYAGRVEDIKSRAAWIRDALDDDLNYVGSFLRSVEADLPEFLKPLAGMAITVQRTFNDAAWMLARQRYPLVNMRLHAIENAPRLLDQLEQERRQVDRAAVIALRILRFSGSADSLRNLRLGDVDLFAHLLKDPSTLVRLAAEKPADAAAINALWATLSPDQRRALAQKYPALIGNLEGVPYSDRSIANRAQLHIDIDKTVKFLRHHPLDSDATNRLTRLLAIGAALGRDEGAGEAGGRYLVSYELAGRFPLRDQPLAAISYGNLDTADYATYLVPGMDATTEKMGDLGGQAQAIRDTQRTLLGPRASVAVVAWLGYVTPDKVSVASNDLAEKGAVRLAAALDGYAAVQAGAGHKTHLGVVAHSYGSTTAMLALQDNHGVDSLVAFGSAGQVPDTTVDLPKDDFYVVTGGSDRLAPLGIAVGGREDPADSGHATPLSAGSESYRDSHGRVVILKPATGFLGHDGYLRPGTSSLQNIAAGGLGIDAEDYR